MMNIEKAARELCRLRGLDPDERVVQSGGHHDYYGFCPLWMNMTEEIKRSQEVAAALAFAGLNTAAPGRHQMEAVILPQSAAKIAP